MRAASRAGLPAVLVSCLLLGGCASFGARKPAATNIERVVAAGMAPIVKEDISGARKASLDDAMKNALGLVNGVYVSQESFVSKVVLLEDTILTQTRGHIERYSILQESQENGFYKTVIKAEIRKDDPSAGHDALTLESKLRAITVAFDIDESVDGAPFALHSAQNALKIKFARKGFVVTESPDADIVISGKAAANLAPNTAIGGFISYRAVLSLTVKRQGSKETVAVVQETDGGVDITKEAAANASLVSAANKAARGLTESVSRIVQEHAFIRLTVLNVNSIACLNTILRSVRSHDAVKDCRVRSFTGWDAELDLEARRGAAFEIARHLERLASVKIEIKQTKPDDIQAICLFSNDF